MRHFGLVMLAALSAVGCVSEQECREGTVLVRVDFLANAEAIDGVKVRYRLDEGALSELPALPRPNDTAVGSFALDVRGYANHKQLLLQYAPLKGSRIVGTMARAGDSACSRLYEGSMQRGIGRRRRTGVRLCLRRRPGFARLEEW